MKPLTARDLAFIGLLAAITLVNPLSIHFYLPALPAIKAAFEISSATAQLTFSISMLTLAVTTLAIGSMSDALGRRPVLLGGIALFVLGGAVCVFADRIEILLVGRVLQAMGAASGIVLARAIARDVFGLDRLTQVIAYLTMAYVMGPLLAVPFGGHLVDDLGWRAIFWLAIGLGGALLILSFKMIPETRAVEHRMTSGRAVLGGYVRLLSKLRFCLYVFQSGFVTGAFFSLAAASSFIMNEMLGLSAAEFGLYFLFFPAGYLIGNFTAGRLSGRVKIDTMVIFGSGLNFIAVVGLGLAMWLNGPSPLALFIPGFFITLAQGLALPNAQSGAIAVDKDLAGTAAGIGYFMQMFLGALGSQLTGWLADGTEEPTVAIMLCMSLAALTASLLLRLPRLRNTPNESGSS